MGKLQKLITENLFLLEFVVEKIDIYTKFLPRELCFIPGETGVSFSVFNQAPLDICETDFNGQTSHGKSLDIMKNGKSCLFALTPKQCKEIMKKFVVNIGVYKRYNYPFLPAKIQIGQTSISIKNEFSKIIAIIGNKGNKQPIARTHSFNQNIKAVLSEKACCIGQISIFIRISCFGKTIVTDFHMNLCEQSVYFKDRDGKSLYKYYKPANTSSEPKSVYDTSSATSISDKSGFENNAQPCETQCLGTCNNKNNYNNNNTNNYSSCTCAYPNYSSSNAFEFPACDIVVPPLLNDTVPDNNKMPRSIVACGVEPKQTSAISKCTKCGFTSEPPNSGEPCSTSKHETSKSLFNSISQLHCSPSFCGPQPSTSTNCRAQGCRSKSYRPYCPSPGIRSNCSSPSGSSYG